MKIAVVGSGYVGLALGACLAENGKDAQAAPVAKRLFGNKIALAGR